MRIMSNRNKKLMLTNNKVKTYKKRLNEQFPGITEKEQKKSLIKCKKIQNIKSIMEIQLTSYNQLY